MRKPQPHHRPKTIPSVRHESAIPARAQRRGFADALYRHTSVRLGTTGRIVPDGFIIDDGRKRIYLFEVVVTHDITEDKLKKLRIIRDVLADLGWVLRVAIGSIGGTFRRIDWDTGRPEVSKREMRWAVNSLNLGRRP